jgi:2-hydroxycyclohexanecarboxyl-CoA dehydrogenase
MTIEGKVILITGAGSGIGRALAVGFTGDYAHVIGFDVDPAGLTGTAQACTDRFMPVEGDVTLESDVDHLVTASMERFGHIDALFNNAATGDGAALFQEVSFEKWARTIQVNLIGVALCTHRVLPIMLQQGYGRIINVASRAAEVASRGRLSAYGSSKAGVITFTKKVAGGIDRELYPDVLINTMIPALIKTPGWDGFVGPGGLISRAEFEKRGQAPETMYPHARLIVELPAGGPNGRAFFEGQDYPVYQHFND